jgi:hypothetical protein
MEKCFARCLLGSLAGALLVLGLPAVPPSSGQAARPAWWEVRLSITAKGEYFLRGGVSPISGEYACRARWEGRLEPDGDDFLLVHIRTEILEWDLKEKAGPAGHTTFLEAPDTLRPDLRLNYVLKEGYEVEFDFDLEGISIPLHDAPFKIVLELPRSSERAHGLPGQGYGDFVCSGSSRVVIPETDLLQQTTERRFSWGWRRENELVQESPVLLLTQSHSVEAVVALVSH